MLRDRAKLLFISSLSLLMVLVMNLVVAQAADKDRVKILTVGVSHE